MPTTAPCSKCGREVMRDGTAGLLVCTCGQLLELPEDLEGPLNPSPEDRRWFGNEDERADLHELGLPTPELPLSQRQALEQLRKRMEELREPVTEPERHVTDVQRDRALAEFERRRREGHG